MENAASWNNTKHKNAASIRLPRVIFLNLIWALPNILTCLQSLRLKLTFYFSLYSSTVFAHIPVGPARVDHASSGRFVGGIIPIYSPARLWCRSDASWSWGDRNLGRSVRNLDRSNRNLDKCIHHLQVHQCVRNLALSTKLSPVVTLNAMSGGLEKASRHFWCWGASYIVGNIELDSCLLDKHSFNYSWQRTRRICLRVQTCR